MVVSFHLPIPRSTRYLCPNFLPLKSTRTLRGQIARSASSTALYAGRSGNVYVACNGLASKTYSRRYEFEPEFDIAHISDRTKRRQPKTPTTIACVRLKFDPSRGATREGG